MEYPMRKNLENELCFYLAELDYAYDNETDWIKKDLLAAKINAVNELLETSKTKRRWADTAKEIISNFKNL